MGKISIKIKQWYYQSIENVEFSRGDGLNYWRERIFNGLILVLFVFGTVALVPNLIASIANKTHLITFFDGVIYIAVCILFLNKGAKLIIKASILIGAIYLLGIVLLVFLGPFGPGLVYLSATSIIAALLIGKNTAVHTIFINAIIIFILALLIHSKQLHTPFFENYTTFTWIAVSLNVLIINSISSIPLAILIEGLEKMIFNEKLLKNQLKESNEQLQVEMEHAKESDRLKSAFLANLSHEIRTPMNAIIGFSELIQMEEVENERIEKYGKYVIENSYFLQNLINDIVDISLIESGQVRLNYDFHQLKRLFADIQPIIDANPYRVRRPKVSINFIGKESLLIQPLYIDALHIKQVLINLITNSLKYTEKGFILIRVKEVEGMLEFCVQDTGIGIPVEEQSKIFNRFTKIERWGKTVPGIGIGLSICHGLVLAMNGKIWFESDVNNGTKFYFTLPYSVKKIS